MPSKIDYSFSLKNRQNSLTASRHGNEGPSGTFCEHSPFSNIDEGSGQSEIHATNPRKNITRLITTF